SAHRKIGIKNAIGLRLGCFFLPTLPRHPQVDDEFHAEALEASDPFAIRLRATIEMFRDLPVIEDPFLNGQTTSQSACAHQQQGSDRTGKMRPAAKKSPDRRVAGPKRATFPNPHRYCMAME